MSAELSGGGVLAGLSFRWCTVLPARARNGASAAFPRSVQVGEPSNVTSLGCQSADFDTERDEGADMRGKMFRPFVLARLSRLVGPPCCLATMCSMWNPRRNAPCGRWQYSQRLPARRRTASDGPLMPAGAAPDGPSTANRRGDRPETAAGEHRNRQAKSTRVVSRFDRHMNQGQQIFRFGVPR